MMNMVQKTVEVPRVQFIDRVVDDPDRTKKRRKAEGQDQDVDVERFSDLVLPTSQPSLERKVFCASMASTDEVGEEPEQEQAEARGLVQGEERRSEEDETDTQGPGNELVQVAPNMGAGGSHPQATMDQEWAKELREIRRMVEFLVHRERKLEVKTDVAARRLEKLERESSQLEDAEREACLGEALTDRTKVVKLTVDKWFVDKGYGFGRALTGEVVCHPCQRRARRGRCSWSALKHGPQVVSDQARAEGVYRARKAWGQRAWREEKGQREGKPSGATSETRSSADGGIGSPIGEQSLRGMQPSSRTV